MIYRVPDKPVHSFRPHATATVVANHKCSGVGCGVSPAKAVVVVVIERKWSSFVDVLTSAIQLVI